MGFFSWKLADKPRKTIWNKFSRKGPTPCKMLLPDGTEFIEMEYEGYGVFGGVDFFETVSRLNPEFPKELESCGGDRRDHGIELAFSGECDQFPKLVSLECKKTWADLPNNKECDTQGFFE